MKRVLLLLGVVLSLLVLRAEAVTPTILTQPQSITVNNASAAQFSVVATNAVSYQWQFDNNNLVGETNAALSLDDVSSNQAGSYTVVVTSSNNTSVTSAPPAVLTIVPGTIVQWTISTYPDGSSSNFLVQLFDHDKPATVENFIHYMTAGAYSNMFFDRDVASFVLQGGDYASVDRSDTNLDAPHISPGPGFPSQVDNEFSVGPLLHNRFGTIAMALASGETNSANSAFFFNLADNSATLDSQDFTVFGRILSGTNSGSNVLQYFNTLSAPSNGLYTGFSQVPTLPVNYDGTNQPTDASFFYCDFKFLSPPPLDTNPPTVSIAFPAPNAALTNGGDLTVLGTAQDNVGLAQVFVVFSSLAGLAEGDSVTNAAIGTTNWSLDLRTNIPGVYQLTAYAQDGAGNLSAPATVYFTNLAVLTVITNANGVFSTNLQYLTPGDSYAVTAEPPAGEMFVTWQNQGVVSLDPEQAFVAETNATLTVTFISTNLPPGLAITTPAAGSVVQTISAGLTIGGIVPSSVTVTQLTVQLYSQTNAVTPALPASLSGTNWSLAVSNLTGGPYTIVVVAEDSLGQEGLATENFTALVAPPVILHQPANLTVNAGSAADFSIAVSNAVSYQWQLAGTGPLAGATNATLALDNVSTNQSGSFYTVVLTAADGETVTSLPAQLTVVQGTIVTLRISRYADGAGSNVTIELFNHDKPATVENFIHYMTAGAYSNMFLDACSPDFYLEGGDYVTTDRSSDHFDPGPIVPGTNFPSQVDSEFNVGPLIHNEFGTLAAGNAVSSSSSFFFNLADNSATLDDQSGGFTVFGRVLSGSNVLQYFNTLSAPSNGILDWDSYFPALPVNDDGTNAPTDASLFYCDFSFQTPPPVDTIPPTVAVTVPAPSAFFTNGGLSSAQGTAQDNVGLAEVFGILTPLTGTSSNISQTNIAAGTTHWSLSIGTSAPGIYRLTAFSQDGAGNLSAPATVYFTNMTQLVIVTNLNGRLITNAPQYLLPGQQFSFTPEPVPGEQFFSWTAAGTTSLNPVKTFTAGDNLTLTIQYVPAHPAAGLAITAPASGKQAFSVQSVLTVSGTVSATNITQLTCQFYVNSNSVSAPLPAVVTGAAWSLSVTNFTNGAYLVAATATDAAGDLFLDSAHFTLLNVEEMNLNILPAEGGSVSGYQGQFVPPGTYSLKAAPRSGYVFYSWDDGITTTLNPSKTVNLTSNVTLTATFVPQAQSLQGLRFTYPPANARLTNGTFEVAGSLPGSLVLTQMTCHIFFQSNGVTALPQLAALAPAAAKWTFAVSNLTPGPYTVLALGYDDKGNTRLLSENFDLLAKLAVVAQPPDAGAVSAGLNGSYLAVGETYSVSATAKKGQLFAYWTGPVANPNKAATTFVMSNNAVLTANFASNLFPAVAGTYTGLFFDPATVSPTNAGFLTLTTTGTGAFSGQMRLGARTYQLSYSFSYNGFIELEGKGLDGNPLEVVLGLDLTNGADTISGYIADLAGPSTYIWASDLTLHRAVASLASANASPAGNYMVLLQPGAAGGAPVATGYAAVSLQANGVLALGGVLPDNTAISESARISKDGIWPVYLVPPGYQGKGLIIGWQTNTAAGASEGQLFWFKPSDGFATSLTSTGGKFAPPVAGTPYQMVVAEGATNSLMVSQEGQFVPASPVEEISLLPTGIFSGRIDLNGQNLPFKGAFIDPAVGGAGFVLTGNGQNDGFQIIAQP